MVQLSLIAAFAILGSSLVPFTIPAVVGQLVVLGWKLRSVRSLVRVRYAVVWSRWKSLLRAALPLAIGGGLVTLYYNLDAVMLSKLDNFTAVGIYGVAYKFAVVVSALPLALMVPLLGLLVRSWPDDKASFWSASRRGTAIMSISAVLVLTEFTLFAPQAIRLLYGQDFVAGAGAARVVVASECLGFFGAVAVTILVALGRNRRYIIAGLTGLVVNIALNLVMIPRYSYHGAAWATLITEVIVTVALAAPILRIRGRASFPVMLTVKAAVCGGVAAGLAVLATKLLSWPVAAVGSTLVYLFLVHIWRVPGPEGIASLFRDADALPGGDEPADGTADG
jgi:O-antigen/teichoic acid export membrane protein